MADGPSSAPDGGVSAEQGQHTERPQSLSSVYQRRSAFSFPRAAQPEIVRAYQKDTYYREQLQEQLQDVVRSLLGSRTLFQHADLISFLGSVAYFTLSTFGGAQTLGEEYVNAMMTEGKSGRIVGLKRRLAFIFFHVISPFLLSRAYSAARRRLVASHETRSNNLQRARLRAAAMAPRRVSDPNRAKSQEPQPSILDRLVGSLANTLPTMDSITSSNGVFAYFGAAHLALFYLGGRYYKFSQRASGTEYISTISRRPGSKPPSYEVLGFLLGLQLAIKMLLQANRWRVAWQEKGKDKKGAAAAAHESASRLGDTVEIDDTVWSHQTNPPTLLPSSQQQSFQHDAQRSVPLVFPDPDALPSAQELGLDKDADRPQLEAARAASKVKAAEMEGISESLLRCTLCMEQREPQKGTSAVTECGHVFCWDCIYGWAQEKPECPLCRQSLHPSHLLPIYNF